MMKYAWMCVIMYKSQKNAEKGLTIKIEYGIITGLSRKA